MSPARTALALVTELQQLVEEQDRQLAELERQNRDLASRLDDALDEIESLRSPLREGVQP